MCCCSPAWQAACAQALPRGPWAMQPPPRSTMPVLQVWPCLVTSPHRLLLQPVPVCPTACAFVRQRPAAPLEHNPVHPRLPELPSHLTLRQPAYWGPSLAGGPCASPPPLPGVHAAPPTAAVPAPHRSPLRCWCDLVPCPQYRVCACPTSPTSTLPLLATCRRSSRPAGAWRGWRSWLRRPAAAAGGRAARRGNIPYPRVGRSASLPGFWVEQIRRLPIEPCFVWSLQWPSVPPDCRSTAPRARPMGRAPLWLQVAAHLQLFAGGWSGRTHHRQRPLCPARWLWGAVSAGEGYNYSGVERGGWVGWGLGGWGGFNGGRLRTGVGTCVLWCCCMLVVGGGAGWLPWCVCVGRGGGEGRRGWRVRPKCSQAGGQTL